MTSTTPSTPARLSAAIGLAAAAGVLLGMAGAHWRLLSPDIGFRLFGASMVLGGLLALVLGIVGLLQVRKGLGGRRQARLGTLLGAGMVLTLLARISTLGGALPIHDVTTDPSDPPAFVELASHPDNLDRDLSYPHGYAETEKLQREHHPELQPIEVPLGPEATFATTIEAVETLGWTLVWSNNELGTLEAFDESRLFRFVDDIAIRVRPVGTASLVDARSTSRIGVSDLGANAARLEAFRDRLLELVSEAR